jgi:shikimate kinase
MTSSAEALVLVGPMGAGKTSIGRRVAKALGVSFTDTDAVLARANGPIPQIFAEYGEEHFRRLEREAVASALAAGGVVSLGGGAILDAQTRARLAEHRVILLTVQPRVVAARLRDESRPLLSGGDAMARWKDIYAARRPLYEEVADATFDTSTGPLNLTVQAIVAWARNPASIPEEPA